jgi:hypothetical protein
MEGSLGLISSKLLIEGPIIEDKLSFAVSGRRTYLDILASPFIAAFGNGAKAGYFFHDYNAKMQYKINERHRLFLSGYFGKDKVYVEDRYTGSPQLGNGGFEDVFAVNMQWGNEIGALRSIYSDNRSDKSNIIEIDITIKVMKKKVVRNFLMMYLSKILNIYILLDNFGIITSFHCLKSPSKICFRAVFIKAK